MHTDAIRQRQKIARKIKAACHQSSRLCSKAIRVAGVEKSQEISSSGDFGLITAHENHGQPGNPALTGRRR